VGKVITAGRRESRAMKTALAVILLCIFDVGECAGWLPSPCATRFRHAGRVQTTTLGRTLSAETDEIAGPAVVVENVRRHTIIGTEMAREVAAGRLTLFARRCLSVIQASTRRLRRDRRTSRRSRSPGSPPLGVRKPLLPRGQREGLIAYASERQGQLRHLRQRHFPCICRMELFKSMTGTYMLHIPYKAARPW